ncbi:MAG: dTMP kinase [Hyphococcus sp.]
MKQAGAFISFEGGDGAGKSTQIRLLANTLGQSGRDVVVTREPGGTDGAEAIRELLVKGDADRWSPMAEALLMYAARADHLEKTILPALARGEIVITDRFADSTMAYQGYAGQLGRERVDALNGLVVRDHAPDLTFILDAGAAEGLTRATGENDETRFEAKGLDYQERVRRAFLAIAKEAPDRCVVIDARQPIDSVAAAVLTQARARLPHIFD